MPALSRLDRRLLFHRMKFVKKRNIILAAIAIFIIIFLAIWIAVEYLAHRFYPLDYQDTIKENSVKYSLDPAQVSAIIYEESKFDPDVVSSKDAIGLMQILPDTANVLAKEMGINNLWRDDLFVPSINIKFGAYYYRELLDKYGNDQDLALAAYNAGFGAVDKAEKKINNLPRETQEFVKRTKKTERVYITLYAEQLEVGSREKMNWWELAAEVWGKIINKRH